MRVIMHLYKSHDPDLVALHKSGYSVSRLAKRVIEAYAHGERIRLLIPECRTVDISDTASGREGGLRTEFITKDPETVDLLTGIVKNRRNQFCKAMVRNALIEQPLVVFFTDPKIIRLENEYLYEEKQKGAVCFVPKNIKKTAYEEITKRLKKEYHTDKHIEDNRNKEGKESGTDREIQVMTDNDVLTPVSPVIIGAVPKVSDDRDVNDMDFDMTDVSGLLSSMVQEF